MLKLCLERKWGMLKVFFGKRDSANYIYNTSLYFNNVYKNEWIISEIGKKIIKEIDKSDVISSNVIDSPILGPITPLQVSGGTKTLLLVYFDRKKVFNASTCGNNCAKYFLEFAKDEDITINLRHLMDFGKGDFEILILNNKKIAHNMLELIEFAEEYV